MAAKPSSYDTIASLLSTNNTINVATLVGACLFGILATYGCILTWRHQRWERRLRHSVREGLVGDSDNLEAGAHGDAYGMGDMNALVGEHPDNVYAGDPSDSQPGVSSRLAGKTTNGPTAVEARVQEAIKSMHETSSDPGNGLPAAKGTQHPTGEHLLKSDASLPSITTAGLSIAGAVAAPAHLSIADRDGYAYEVIKQRPSVLVDNAYSVNT